MKTNTPWSRDMVDLSPIQIFGFTLAIAFVGVYLVHAASR
jgi:hypothetical protein